MAKYAHFEFGEGSSNPKTENNCGLLSSIFNVERLFQRYLPKKNKNAPQNHQKNTKNAHFVFWEDPSR